MRRRRRPSSIRGSTALKRLAGRKRPGAPGIMAVDIAKSDRHWDQTKAAFPFLQGMVG
jgi:hypothetical protein